MAWEWHDRRRSGDGRFAAKDLRHQLHIYGKPEIIAQIRDAAFASRVSVSDYVIQACQLVIALRTPLSPDVRSRRLEIEPAPPGAHRRRRH